MAIEITLNGENRSLPESTTIQQFVAQLGLGDKKIAIEINREIIPRGKYEATLLDQGDKVEIVHAIGGG